MDDFDFVIPLSIDALREASTSQQYVVATVFTVREIPQRFQECSVAYRQDGPHFILSRNNFDCLYSILVNFANLEEELLMTTWELMLKAMSAMSSRLSTILEETDLSSTDMKLWLNILKMNTYISCQLMEAFENNHNKPTTETIALGKKGRGRAKKSQLGVDWEEERNRMLLQLYCLLQASLQRLWDPPIMEEDYVNLIANCCYKIMESNTINLVRTKPTRDSIFQIIGSLVKRFNHGLGCSLKLMQLLQHFEHMVSPAAQGVCLMIEQYQSRSVLQDMIREVVKIDPREMSKDASGLRNYSQFFIEVSEKNSELFIPSLPLLVGFLDQEAYSMRNCVISILGCIVLNVLSGEDLDAKSKTLRDECLDYLEDFIHDTNAFVRSKVLQVWEQLIERQAVPLTHQQHVLKKIVGRLRDKSSNVRKNALHLLSAFLKANPFAAKLPLEELQKQYEEELKNLQELSPGSSLEAEDVHAGLDSIYDSWIKISGDVISSLKKVLDDDLDMKSDDEDGHSDEEEKEPANCEKILPVGFLLNEGITAVGEFLFNKEYMKAVESLKEVLNSYTDAEVLQFAAEEEGKEDPKPIPDEISELSEEQRYYLMILQRIFLCFLSMMRQKEMEEGKGSEQGKELREMRKKQEEIAKQKMLCSYLKDSVSFAKEIHNALPVICQLLGSRQNTDILEAIQFFVTAFEFGLLNAMTGVRKMLVLVWSKEPTIKETVVQAYRRLYIDVVAPNERARALHIVKNLSALINGATHGEITSMEEIVSEFMGSGDIDKHCITLLWERFTKAIPETTDEESISSLILLTMAANSQMNIISSNLKILIQVGLGDRGENDFSLVKAVCSALLKLSVTKPKTDSAAAPFRLEEDHEIFQCLKVILVNGISKLEDAQYSPMATEAITTIYLLAEHPDAICQDILQEIMNLINTLSKNYATEESSQENIGLQVPVKILSRFFVVVGHVASRELVHLDTFIFSELKRRNHLRESQKEKEKKKRNTSKRKPLATSASEVSVSKTLPDGDIEEEMGLTGAVADDMEAEFIRNVCETEIVTGQGFLAVFKSLIIGVCANPTKYSDPSVRAAASLALGKFMMVSTECCEENMQLLFTILEKSTEPVIRANTIIVIGDLTFRFPNLVEPWTPRIYARLRDESSVVRRNTLTVLTNLILNDQVKVKGQISDIALCITDEDSRIAGLSKMFFNELSKKGNALYNILPDIISRLSDVQIGIKEGNFRAIISHIFALIQKDRQLETFIEKLCHRLQATTDIRQWRDLTYCLSLLPYTEKGIRRLTENFSCYSDKLHDQDVYEMFTSILSSSKKLAKVEMRAAVEELEARIEESHKKGVEDENAVNKAFTSKKRTKNRRRSLAKGKSNKDSESSDQDSGDDEALHPAHRNYKENVPPESIRTRLSTRRPTRTPRCMEEDSSSDSEDSFIEQPKARQREVKIPLQQIGGKTRNAKK